MTETHFPQPGNGSAGGSSVNIANGFMGEWTTSKTGTWAAPAAIARTRKVAILGFGGTARDAPAADPSWELWAMNGFWRAAKPDYNLDIPDERYSLWFDMHSIAYTRAYGKLAGIGDQQERWLEKPHPYTIFALEETPEFPSVRAFPIEETVSLLGRDYFTSTVAYALAYALAQPDIAEIGLWGIDLVHSTEYSDQRPCAEYWIGRAEAAGIKVTVHEQSALLRQRNRYGYEDPNPLVSEIQSYLHEQDGALQKAITDQQASMEKLVGSMHTNDGALQMLRTIIDRMEIYSRGGRI